MSAFADLEDDLPDKVPAQGSSLFADDEDDDDEPATGTAGAGQAFSDDEEGPAPVPAAAAAQPQDIKAKLAALAEKKRREAAGEGDGGGGSKKRKSDGDTKSDKKRKKDKPSRPLRSSSSRDASQAGARPKRTGGDSGPQASDDSQQAKPSRADADFIDDEGDVDEEEVGSDVAPDDEDSGPGGPPPEAQEVDEAMDADLQDAFGRPKKKRSHESEHQMGLHVVDLTTKMETMAELDMEDHLAGKPALHKLKMLREAEEFLAQRKYHELFIAQGGLGVLKAWLEPYRDGSLPNHKVRAAVLRACQALPIDTSREDMKENLKKSQLGSRILFLARCPHESQANRKLAGELVAQWSKPIFFDGEAEAEKRRQKELELQRSRVQMQLQTQKREAAMAAANAAKAKIKHGEAGYRWHAVIPQTSKLDYVVAPQSDQSLAADASNMPSTSNKKDEGRFVKKMRDVVRKQKGSNARAAVPSVEGRNIVLMH
ncbi:hypothetical protein V8C86DRAFT_2637178 [Haematococcus lacustris]